MPKNALANELLDLENQYWKAIKEKDFDAAMRLTDESCILAGAQGVGRVSRDKMGEMLKNAPHVLQAFELNNPEVLELRDDVAILAYNVHEELSIDGKPVKVDAADASTWIRRNGQWLCALHTEALAGDRYGRDRRPTRS
jgi:hypothetical protein